jgi:hypothetical protein
MKRRFRLPLDSDQTHQRGLCVNEHFRKQATQQVPKATTLRYYVR